MKKRKLTKVVGSLVLSAAMIASLTTSALAAIGWSDEEFEYVQEFGVVTSELTTDKKASLLDEIIFDEKNTSEIKEEYQDYFRTGKVDLSEDNELDMQFDKEIVDEQIVNGTKYIVLGKDIEGNEYTRLCVAIPFKKSYVVLYDVISGGTLAINSSDLSKYSTEDGIMYASETLSNTTYATSADVIYALDRNLTTGKSVTDIMGMLEDGAINFDNMKVVVDFVTSDLERQRCLS